MVLIPVSGSTYDTTPDHNMVNVDPEFLEALLQVTLSWTPQGYVSVNKRLSSGELLREQLHNYIFVHLRGNKIPEGKLIHHINNHKWDNILNNLELTNRAHNSAAVDKKTETSTSRYKGVSLTSSKNVWHAQINVDKRNISLGDFKNELDAAKAYDRAYLAVHNSINGSNLLLEPLEISIITKNPEHYQPRSKRVDRELPKNVYKDRSGLFVRIGHKGETIQRRFNSLDDAVKFRDDVLHSLEQKRQAKIKEKPILRNNDGTAIIPVKIFKSDRVLFTKVSDCDYYTFVQERWYLNRGYVWSRKFGEMQTAISNNKDASKVTDHINRDPLDNQHENIRVVSRSFNNRNKRKREGTLSQYVGVSFYKPTKKWIARIKIHGKEKSLGYFHTEEEARDAYNEEYRRLENLENI